MPSAARTPERSATVIDHGLDLERHTPGRGDDGYVLVVGRVSADQGSQRAIRIAGAARCPLVLVAKFREPEEHDFFAPVGQPLIGPDVTGNGEVATTERVQLFRHAEAPVDPICRPEPFGLVMAEVLAGGVPVLAFPNGAAPEIVDDGRTGVRRCDGDGLACAAGRLGEIDRRNCRHAAASRLSMERMADDREALEARLVRRTARRHRSLGGPDSAAELDLPVAGAGRAWDPRALTRWPTVDRVRAVSTAAALVGRRPGHWSAGPCQRRCRGAWAGGGVRRVGG